MSRKLTTEFDEEATARDLGGDFDEEEEIDTQFGTPQKSNWRESPKASDKQLLAFKEQLEPKIGAIESIKRVLGRPEVIVACLAIGTCVLYKIVNGNLVPFTTGGKTRRKKRNKKRTLRRKSK